MNVAVEYLIQAVDQAIRSVVGSSGEGFDLELVGVTLTLKTVLDNTTAATRRLI